MNLEHINSLNGLEQAVEAFAGCPLRTSELRTVFADGDASTARIMVIGEAPGAEEDKSGQPFVGRSGQLLRQLLGEAGFSDADLYITNMMFWRPPANRTPTKAELQTTLPFVHKHIELVAPQALILVGNVPAQTLLNTKVGVTKLRGAWHTYAHNGMTVPALPVFHPAYLLRNRNMVSMMAADLGLVRAAIK